MRGRKGSTLPWDMNRKKYSMHPGRCDVLIGAMLYSKPIGCLQTKLQEVGCVHVRCVDA